MYKFDSDLVGKRVKIIFCDGMMLIGEIIGFTSAVDNDGEYASMDFFCDSFPGSIVREYENEIDDILLLDDF